MATEMTIMASCCAIIGCPSSLTWKRSNTESEGGAEAEITADDDPVHDGRCEDSQQQMAETGAVPRWSQLTPGQQK